MQHIMCLEPSYSSWHVTWSCLSSAVMMMALTAIALLGMVALSAAQVRHVDILSVQNVLVVRVRSCF